MLASLSAGLAIGFAMLIDTQDASEFLPPVIATGFAGALSTWSTLAAELSELIKRKQWRKLVRYLGFTLAVGSFSPTVEPCGPPAYTTDGAFSAVFDPPLNALQGEGLLKTFSRLQETVGNPAPWIRKRLEQPFPSRRWPRAAESSPHG